MMVLDEIPEPPLLSWLGGLLGGVGVGVSVMETIISLVTRVTWPFSCVLSIWVLLADVRTICDTEVGELGGGGVVELLGEVEGGSVRLGEDEGEVLELDAEKWRKL